MKMGFSSLALLFVLIPSFTSSASSGPPDFSGDVFPHAMTIDYVRVKQWKHLTLLRPPSTDESSFQKFKKVYLQSMKSASVQVINLDERYRSNMVSLNSRNFAQESTNNFISLSVKYKQEFVCYWGSLAMDFLEEAGSKGYFSIQQEWLVILKQNMSLDDAISSMGDLPIYISSEVIVAHWEGEQGEWLLTEIWKPGPGASFSQNLVGFWSKEYGLKFLDLDHKYQRRKDMKGFHLRVATIKTMPYESLLADSTKQNFHSGYVVDLWHSLQEQMNFTYTAKNTLFGSLQKDGVTWNGMVGMVQKNEADFAVAPLSITQIRSLSIDFTVAIQIVSTRLYIKRPTLEATWDLYILPFDSFLWICIPCVMVITAFFLWLLNKIAIIMKCEADEISPFSAFWVMFSGLVQQSVIIEPKMFSGKLVFFMGFLGSLVVYTCYSAILVSILTTMKPTLPFKDFVDLRNRPDWDVGVRTNTALSDSLALSPIGSPRRDAWENHVAKNPEKNLPKSNDMALKYVLEGKYAFFANKEYIIYRLQNVLPIDQATDIIDTGEDFLVRGIGFGIQKNSPYKEIFNYYLSLMTSSGQIDRLKQKWWPTIDRRPDPSYPVPGFAEVFTVYLIFGIGIFLAVSFFCCERYSRNDKIEDGGIKAMYD